jgi:hypothetical protein
MESGQASPDEHSRRESRCEVFILLGADSPGFPASAAKGALRVLRPFDEVSRLLRGIRDYRVAVLEVNPRSFVVPSHTYAHCICYVAEGT